MNDLMIHCYLKAHYVLRILLFYGKCFDDITVLITCVAVLWRMLWLYCCFTATAHVLMIMLFYGTYFDAIAVLRLRHTI